MTNAINSTGTANFPPLDLEQFRQGFVLFLYVLSGQAKASPPLATYLDADTGRTLPVEDTLFNRARIAGGKLFTDKVLRHSFYQRLDLFGSLARDPKYDRYIGFCLPSLHMAFVAALARVSLRKGMTENACIAAFDEELRRHLGETAEDRAGQAGAARWNRVPPLTTNAARASSPSAEPPAWSSTRRAAVTPSGMMMAPSRG
jgi:hypothetical protein